MRVIMIYLFENTQNVNPTKGITLLIKAEISKKRTNFGTLATAKRSVGNVH